MVPGYDSSQASPGIEGLTRPDPKDRAAQIVAWAVCWPWNVVWTCCVYNPFRFIAEFLLKEIQSALFEISNGQFSAIERDLTLDPSPPPFPVHERRTPSPADSDPGNAEAASTSVASASVSVAVNDTPNDIQPSDSGLIASSPTAEVPAQQPSATGQQSDSPPETSGESQSDVTDSLPTDAAQDLADSESSDSYAWAPPEPTAFVAMSNKQLRGVRVTSGNRSPGKTSPTSSPPKSPADPWFEKHGPDR
jgi:hypothetical protein